MKHELLVPVGDYPSLIAAINNGADAVYLGGKKFGARAFANNFTLEEILNATKLCHLYGVKIYITVNTLIYENEIEEVLSYIKNLHKIGVDALIMQDIGLINLVHQTLPNLEIHASTQMHNHSSESLSFLKELGVKRVVFARELPLDYINNINTTLEKEVFIHGSLCVSYSGQCLFSSAILGRSGNRGECAGMCRLPYKLYENNNLIKTKGDYLLSPKDLCTIDNFKQLMDSNIKCFKIEGRMKSAAYVGIVTKIYKNLMQKYENGKELKTSDEDLFLLKAIFNREYTNGYLFNEKDIINLKAPNHMGVSIGKVTEVTKKKIKIKLSHELKQFESIRFKKNSLGLTINYMYDKNNNLISKGKKDDIIYLDNFINLKELDEVLLTNPLVKNDDNVIKKIPINIILEAKINKLLEIKINDGLFNITLNNNYLVLESKTAALSKERIEQSLRKCGNTPFIINNIEIIMDENIFIPISILNDLRRKALDKLKNERENKKTKYIEKEYQKEKARETKVVGLSVLVRTEEQLKACLFKNVENIIVINKKLLKNNLCYRILRDEINHNENYNNLLVTDIASLNKYKNKNVDYFLNVTNHYTLDYLKKYSNIICLSPECNIDNIKDIINNTENKDSIEVYLYGNIELMIMKYCPLNTLINNKDKCNICMSNNKYYLKDRNNSYYRIDSNILNHSTTILNTYKNNLLDKINLLKRLGVKNFRLELLDENYNETIKLIERVYNNE